MSKQCQSTDMYFCVCKDGNLSKKFNLDLADINAHHGVDYEVSTVGGNMCCIKFNTFIMKLLSVIYLLINDVKKFN